MFYISKDLINVNSRIEYPLTVANVNQSFCINGVAHHCYGDSEVKCDEGDKFKEGFGIELAETNATIDMLKEYKEILIKMTKQPEWRKEKPKEEYIVGPGDSKRSPDEFVSVNMFNNTTDKTFKFTVEEI